MRICETFTEFCKRNNIQSDQPDEFVFEGIKIICKEPEELIEDVIAVCKEDHIVVITDSSVKSLFGAPNSLVSNGLKYLHKCPNPLIGIDVALFTEHPEFPYRTDRPKCFYNVRVDGSDSSYEAFYREGLRWKMILNRIQYSGGFIDGSQILSALNITRTCKQPSWFSKSFAKSIINKYCTSDVIVDCCAGWGARHDAALELHRTYIGCDYNRELVEWHHELGRAGIVYEDARKFTYEGECSVFTCPPYSDPKTGRCFEDYNFDGFDDSAIRMTQCDWLMVAMKNIPNAREYVMVCKIVDNGWGKYIVDRKVNKSHFGVNNEYILCVSNAEAKAILAAHSNR